MAQDRKTPPPDAPGAGEKLPFPSVRKSDPEDVSWALSTADAMWRRGDHVEALKWIRRAAEAASECDADARALELAKVAADLSSQIDAGERPTRVAPEPLRLNPVTPAAQPVAPALTPPASKRVPPSETKPPPLPSAKSPTPPKVAASATTPKPSGATPLKAVEVKPRRRSQTNLSEEARLARDMFKPAVVDPEATAETAVPIIAPETRRRGRSRPAYEEAPKTKPRPDDPDAWPTASLTGEEMSDLGDERTRIGTPAYVETAFQNSSPPPATALGPTVRPSQAVRVVIYRGPDGLQIAPHGTKVSAIAIDGLLVALDPTADLAGWLTKK